MSRKTKNPPKKNKQKRDHQVFKPFIVTKSISNKERGGPHEKTPNIKGLSYTVTTHFKIEIVYARCKNTIKCAQK